jgi:hypothetical protein
MPLVSARRRTSADPRADEPQREPGQTSELSRRVTLERAVGEYNRLRHRAVMLNFAARELRTSFAGSDSRGPRLLIRGALGGLEQVEAALVDELVMELVGAAEESRSLALQLLSLQMDRPASKRPVRVAAGAPPSSDEVLPPLPVDEPVSAERKELRK